MAYTIHYYDLDERRETKETFATWQAARTRFNVLESLRRAGERIMELEFRGDRPWEAM